MTGKGMKKRLSKNTLISACDNFQNVIVTRTKLSSCGGLENLLNSCEISKALSGITVKSWNSQENRNICYKVKKTYSKVPCLTVRPARCSKTVSKAIAQYSSLLAGDSHHETTAAIKSGRQISCWSLWAVGHMARVDPFFLALSPYLHSLHTFIPVHRQAIRKKESLLWKTQVGHRGVAWIWLPFMQGQLVLCQCFDYSSLSLFFWQTVHHTQKRAFLSLQR